MGVTQKEIDDLIQLTDYYEILGITQSADENKIKKAYLLRARKYHPDKNPGKDSKEVRSHIRTR